MSLNAESPESLMELARAIARQAHAPYSGLSVGAAMRSAAGAVYVGANVENAAYPLGNCAEASAIAAGVAAEGSAFRIAEVAVHAQDADGNAIAASPCGGCRQRLREFVRDLDVPVQFLWEGRTRTMSLGELLPCSFELRGKQPRG